MREWNANGILFARYHDDMMNCLTSGRLVRPCGEASATCALRSPRGLGFRFICRLPRLFDDSNMQQQLLKRLCLATLPDFAAWLTRTHSHPSHIHMRVPTLALSPSFSFSLILSSSSGCTWVNVAVVRRFDPWYWTNYLLLNPLRLPYFCS